jgi:hypothetical protein
LTAPKSELERVADELVECEDGVEIILLYENKGVIQEISELKYNLALEID